MDRGVSRILAAPAAALLLLTAAGSARADDPAGVVVPQHTRATNATLIGASATGVAVLRDGASAGDPDVVQTGAWGQTLQSRPEVTTTPGFREQFLPGDVTGGVLAWGMAFHGSNTSSVQLHRTDLLTGAGTLDGRVSGRSFQLTGDGPSDVWVSSPDPYSQMPLGRAGVVRLPVPTAPADDEWPATTEIWKPTDLTSSWLAWAADASSAVLAVRLIGPGTTFEPAGPLQILSVPLDGGPPRTLVTAPAADLEDLALSSTTMAWSSRDASGRRSVSVVAREGGTPVTHVETDARAGLHDLAVTDSGTVGYLVPGAGTHVTLRTLTGGSVRDVVLPGASAGLAAVGPDFVTATGRGAAPGVYRIAPGSGPDLAATLAVPEHPLRTWDLSAGRVYYTDRSKGSAARLPVWSRAVGEQAAGEPVDLGAESRLAAPAGTDWATPAVQPISFSGARGLVGSPAYPLQWDLLDRGRRTVSVEQIPVKDSSGTRFATPKPQVSGPYVLVSGQVHGFDGELLHVLPAAARHAGRQDLFGSTVLYGTTTAQQGQVWLVDAENPKPEKLFQQTCGHAPPVALWGRTAAWLNCTGTRASVRDRVTGTTRTVVTGIPATTDPADVTLTAGEGTLAWTAAGQASVLDLSHGDSVPSPLTGSTASLVLDRNLVARTLENSDGTTDLTIDPLPFAVPSHPRLTGLVRLLGFTPGAGGGRGTWSPAFDTTEPLSSATLRIVSVRSGRTVRTLTTTDVADGSIRDLAWDGLSGAGNPAATGYYTWTLTARSPAGAALTTADGSPGISGRIELIRRRK